MGSSETSTMPSTSVLVASVLAVALILPSNVVSKPQELKCPNGDPFYSDAGSVDANGCTVGYCAKVCPTGAFTNDGRQTTFRGNKGPTGTGSNGNAGPLNQAGLAVDPAAVSLLKQQEEYIKWAQRQAAGRK